MINVTIDFEPLKAFQENLMRVIERDSIPTVAASHKKRILGLTAAGSDALGEVFHPYGESQRKRREALGLPVDVKTLRVSNAMMDSLGLRGNILTVADDQQSKALGQVTGHSGKWGYKHNFLDSAIEGNEEAGRNLASHITMQLFG
jgi:hypothetical protein